MKNKPLSPKHVQMFFSKIATLPDANGCWNWIGAPDITGYGRCKCINGEQKSHRVSWRIFNGELPEGKLVLHRCDNPPCVNPDHLFLGTDGDNSRDRNNKRRQAYGSRNGEAKVSEKEVMEIRRLHVKYSRDRSYSAIGKMYGISGSAVDHIVNRYRWKHL